MLYKGFLQWMKAAVRSKALHGRNVAALILDGQRETGVDPLTVHQHGACPACSLIAAFLRAGQMKIVAHEIEQRGADIRLDLHCRSIDVKSHCRSPHRKARDEHVFTACVKLLILFRRGGPSNR